MNTPANCKFAKSDEWVAVNGATATLGVSDYAQDQLSDVVFVEITVEVGDTIKQGEHIATIESVKAAADVNSPISGKVIEINESLPDTPELVNSDPYGKAWMIKLEVSDTAEVSALMDDKAYAEYCANRGH